MNHIYGDILERLFFVSNKISPLILRRKKVPLDDFKQNWNIKDYKVQQLLQILKFINKELNQVVRILQYR